jgi:FlaG protein
MPDSKDLHLGPVPPVGNAAPVQPVRADRVLGLYADHGTPPHGHEVAATTGGSLPPAYAQFMVDQDTNDVVISIHDPTTNRVIAQYPSVEIEAMAKSMKQYADTLARHRAAFKTGSVK